MKQIPLTILKYLDKHDTGNFIDVRKAFPANKIPSRAEIERAYDYLKEYIDLESIYEHHGFDYAGEEGNFERPLQKARIHKKGSEFLIELKEKQKRHRWVVIGIVVAALISLLGIAARLFSKA